MKLTEMGTKASYKKMNKIFESRFGFAIDYKKLTIYDARKIVNKIGESLTKIRKSHGIHSAEKSPKYMELILVSETLRNFIKDKTRLNEGEVGQAEVILAAKSMVDSVQDMIEKIGKLQNEELPPLMDSIRDQLGTDKATAYRGQIEQALASLFEQLSATREALDTGARVLSGEESVGDMNMGGMDAGGMGGAPAPMAGAAPGGESDSFAASDAAAGGTSPLGRELR